MNVAFHGSLFGVVWTILFHQLGMFFLCLFRDNEIECVLFDQVASDVAMSQAQNIDTDPTLVAIINLARITWSLHSMLIIYLCLINNSL